MLAVSMPNFATSSALVETAAKCRHDSLALAKGAQYPLAGSLRVGHGFQRGESLRRNDKKCLFGVQVAGVFGKIRSVYIGDEPKNHVASAVMAQSQIGHYRAKVRTADPDIDDVSNTFSRIAFPFPASHTIWKSRPCGRALRGPRASRSGRPQKSNAPAGARKADVQALHGPR